MKVLVLGASGLLGSALFRVLSETTPWNVLGAIRDPEVRHLFPPALVARTVLCGDLEQPGVLEKAIASADPDVLLNCLSVRKSELTEGNLRKVVASLSVLPQRMAHVCARMGVRLVHFSSDGVFSGTKGGYTEDDLPDATDQYGVAKYLGEVRDPHAVSIRTSMIGHELGGGNGLLEWFLAQEATCNGFPRSVFSGLPTVELARVIRDFVLVRPELSGVYHVAASPISKFDLLQLVADVYGKRIELLADDRVVIDRSLNMARFRAATGYEAPPWPELIAAMHADHLRPTS
jgi:dTDP-4-dehydrorhamnose reductase